MPGTLNLTPTGFHKLLPIKVTRDGLEGPVVVRFENVPAGVKIQGITIPADKTQADAEAWAADDADELEGELRVVGQADKARTEFPLKVKIKKR